MTEKTGWKGKDWYTILAPEMFGGKPVYDTPATDGTSLVGRSITVSMTELNGDMSQLHMKLIFRIAAIDGKNALTVFNGFSIGNDYSLRLVRKRTKKIQYINYMSTKDKWKVQISALIVLTRVSYSKVGSNVRKVMDEIITEFVSKHTMGEVVEAVIDKHLQRKVREKVNKIYPARASEIEKIEVIKAPGK
ncbi:MAG: hypothetical protein HYX24_00275 [Candidatus Aenigmarchaeota archaeon]|nr:hypothetical protein [Candidatus Aenigmarchaeota archaeon]